MKKRIPAVILMFTLFASSAFAVSTYSKSINVTYGITLSIDGRTPTLTDADGIEVQPFVYQGTTYVPIRAVSENLGATVEYDSNAKKAIINSAPSTSGVTTQDLNVISFLEDLEDLANLYMGLSNNYSTMLDFILSDYDYSDLIPSAASLLSNGENQAKILKQNYSALSAYMDSDMIHDLNIAMFVLDDCTETAQTCQNILYQLNANQYDYDVAQEFLDSYSLLNQLAITVGNNAENAFNQWIATLQNKT